MDSELRTQMLQLVGMADASAELQEGFVYAYERLARRRLGRIVVAMFSDEQVEQVKRMRETGQPDSVVLAWMKSQMTVDFDDLYASVLEAVVQEVYLTPVVWNK